jgi:hypothetical protein
VFAAAALAVVAPAAGQPPEPIPVAMFVDAGVFGKGPDMLEEVAKATNDLQLKRVKAVHIRDGKLKNYRVLVVPGGTGSEQGRTLAGAGRQAVKQWVKDGGVYVGICAGCYLASTGYEWSLDLLPAKVLDKAHWERGTGTVKIEFTDAGKEVMKPVEGIAFCRYANGPILEPLPGMKDKLIPLAHFREELVPPGGTQGVMLNAPAAVAARYGKGWVIGVSPHPEQTDGLRQLVPAAIRWAVARP